MRGIVEGANKEYEGERGSEGSHGPEGYVLRGGRAGADRLRLLNRAKWPTTEALLHRAGLRAGMRVLDLGCGSGDVTLRMAAVVGAGGEVVGVDLDPSVLRVAREKVEGLSLPVSFRRLGADELDEEESYDFAYARYLLSHLRHPGRVVGAMVRALRPAGRLAVEDTFFPGHVCYPPSAAFDRYLELYEAVVRARGADAAIGPRLMGMALDAGLVDVRVELVVPVFRDGAGKQLVHTTMESIREAVVAVGLASGAEVDGIVAELKVFAEDERTLMSIAPTFQVWGRKALRKALR